MYPRTGNDGNMRIAVLVLACLFLGFASGAFWYYRATSRRTANAVPTAEGGLSVSTKAVLRGLDSAIEIRFYSISYKASGSDSLRAFAGRVDQLLSQFQNEANGKIKLVRYNSPSDSAVAAASADGMQPFGLEKGEVCYLGITVAQDVYKESLPQLSAEWESALESDLSRAIARVIDRKRMAARAATPPLDPTVTEEVRRLIPDPASVSLEEGAQILREKAMTEFAATTKDMEAQVKEAEQRFLQAQSDKSEAAQQAARKELQQIRAQQTEKLKQIAARLHDQIGALEQLKKE